MAQEQRSIDELLQTIPQEIYDRIYDETFTAEHQKIDITKSYTPPKLLSIDRASRKKFAASLYANTTFVIDGPLHCLRLWHQTIDPAHRRVLRAVEGKCTGMTPCEREDWPRFRHMVAKSVRLRYGEQFAKMFRLVRKDEKSGDWISWPLGDKVEVLD